MASRRTAKLSEAVREVVSTTILFELRDPRVKNVTVLSAEVAADLRTAKVYVSIMGDEKQQSLCLHGLESARGFLQAKIAERLDTRYTPVLSFKLDQGVKKSIEAARILREVLPPADEESPAVDGSLDPALPDSPSDSADDAADDDRPDDS